ncbi:hypothetical protein [Sagittula sp. SSi028]|uniref:hypothetical protein n=1 Tax=Sagittula sp. SSi028 TaxID=3400636 RepID=UPI003AF43306
MKPIRRLLAMAAGVVLTVSLAHADDKDVVGYQCVMRGAGTYDWIQPVIFVAHNRTDDLIVVSDAMILAMNDGQPAVAQIDTENARRITFTWEVETRLRVSPVTLRFRGTYVKSNGVFSVVAQPRGFDTTLTRSGECTLGRLGM